MDKIPNVLACDVGNTAIRFACVDGRDVTNLERFGLDDIAGTSARLVETWRRLPSPKKLVGCSVNPAGHKALEAAFAEATGGEKLLLIGRDLGEPIETALADPKAIGTDRLCCAAAAYDRIGGACVVADFGTAITIDCVNGEGVFMGGAILPGLAMGAEGLHANTAQLPRVTPTAVDWVFGADTHQAIVGGLVLGARGALRELVELYAAELGRWPTVILTGGDAGLICPSPEDSPSTAQPLGFAASAQSLVQAVVDDLSLRGVAIAYYRSLADEPTL